MERTVILAILMICFSLSEATVEDVNKVKSRLGMNESWVPGVYMGSNTHFQMTATFNVNETEEELHTVQFAFLLYDINATKLWLSSEAAQILFYYVDGSSPVKVESLHENGTSSVEYMGNLLDERCEELNCKIRFGQRVGTTVKKEVVDPEGWALFSFVSSPCVPPSIGYEIHLESENNEGN